MRKLLIILAVLSALLTAGVSVLMLIGWRKYAEEQIRGQTAAARAVRLAKRKSNNDDEEIIKKIHDLDSGAGDSDSIDAGYPSVSTGSTDGSEDVKHND